MLNVQESFLHPESVKCYPLTADLSNLVPIEDVTQAVVEGNPCVLDENLQMLELDTLLLYEPFANLGNTILRAKYSTTSLKISQKNSRIKSLKIYIRRTVRVMMKRM